MESRNRAFEVVFYPESAPEDFRDLISAWHVPALMVLHDKDEGKKAHYHLLLMFSGKKSLAQVRCLAFALGSTLAQPVYDLRGSARYLAHLDSPAKYQYGVECLEAFSGAAVAEWTVPMVDPSPEVIAWVREQGITEYRALIDYCLDHRPDWYRYASAHSIFLCSYLRSARHEGEVFSGGKGGAVQDGAGGRESREAGGCGA
jgi:hypothetical protein